MAATEDRSLSARADSLGGVETVRFLVGEEGAEEGSILAEVEALFTPLVIGAWGSGSAGGASPLSSELNLSKRAWMSSLSEVYGTCQSSVGKIEDLVASLPSKGQCHSWHAAAAPS